MQTILTFIISVLAFIDGFWLTRIITEEICAFRGVPSYPFRQNAYNHFVIDVTSFITGLLFIFFFVSLNNGFLNSKKWKVNRQVVILGILCLILSILSISLPSAIK